MASDSRKNWDSALPLHFCQSGHLAAHLISVASDAGLLVGVWPHDLVNDGGRDAELLAGAARGHVRGVGEGALDALGHLVRHAARPALGTQAARLGKALVPRVDARPGRRRLAVLRLVAPLDGAHRLRGLEPQDALGLLHRCCHFLLIFRALSVSLARSPVRPPERKIGALPPATCSAPRELGGEGCFSGLVSLD